MLSYQQCKNIAVEALKEYGIEIDKAYSIGKDYVFEDSKEEHMGILPIVVSSKDGKCIGLWAYLNRYDMSMDDMRDIDF